MIKLKNIKIKFSREIIRDGELEIPDGAITVIAGESGSGKTSLLYMLGLISSNTNYKYYFDDELIDLKDKNITSKLQREMLGFMFQDNSLIESLTISENIKMMANLAGRDIDEKEIRQLLAEVELSEGVMQLYPPKLSGGELQRASLAAMLAKEPRYIIVDEPTSALDSLNAHKVIAILQRLAQKGCAIVVATHSQEIFDIADKIYYIDNRRIIEKKTTVSNGKELKNNLVEKRSILSFGFKELFKYANAVKKRAKGLNMLLIAFCAIAITGFAVTNNVVTYLEDTQQQLLNQLSDREVFLVNQMSSTVSDIKDYDGNLIINEEEYARIKNMEGVDKVYSLIELRSFSINTDNIVAENSISVTTSTEQYVKKFSLDNVDLPAYFVVLPYFPEQQYDKQLCTTFNSDEQIYISHELAEELELIDTVADSVELEYKISVPVKKYVDVAYENEDESIAHIDISDMQQMKVSVAGVLNSNVVNRYTINGNRVIYVPYDMLYSFVDHAKANFDETVLNEFADYETLEWQPSACVIYADSYKDINIVEGKLENINTHFATRYDYQDTETIDMILESVSNVTKLILGIVLLVIFVLMTMIFINSTVARKREYAILKANGMTDVLLSKLTLIESIMQGTKIVGVSTILSIVISIMLSALLFKELRIMTPDVFMSILVFSILFVMLPSIVSVFYVNTVKADRILRN